MFSENIIITADEPICSAAQKIIYYQFGRVRFHEPGARRGEDIEELHQMRVAVRRIRSAFKTLGKFLPFQTAQSFSSFLGQMTDFLGFIRNLDVFLLNANLYADSLDEPHRIDFKGLLSVINLTRAKRQDLLNAFLDSRVFQDFSNGFEKILSMQTFWEGDRVMTSEVVPAVLLDRFTKVKSFDLAANDYQVKELHRLRIRIKDFRYAIEFFESILGENALTLIEDLKALQDHLGSLNDSVEAQRIIYQAVLVYNLEGDTLKAGLTYIQYLEEKVVGNIKEFSQIWKDSLLLDFEGKLKEIIPK